jgi:hypothetical protein
VAKGKGPAMRKLAVLLEKRAKVPVQPDYTTEGRATTWFVQWSNGPTADTMRRHVTAVANSPG